jgi:Acyltransferase family
MAASPNNDRNIPGIHWLRAIFSVAVVAWHINSFGASLIFSKADYRRHVFVFSDLINFHVLFLAVPIFFLISCYLYARKNPSVQYCRKRLARFAMLAVFWTIAGMACYGGHHMLSLLCPKSLQAFLTTVISAAQTPYYFFVSLIILTVVTHIASKLSTRVNSMLFILACALIFVLAKASIAFSLPALNIFWSPMNFVPYPFAAIVMARNEARLFSGDSRLFIIAAFFAAAILASLYEWRFGVNEIFFDIQAFAMPAYARLSVVFLSVSLFAAVMTRRIGTNRIIEFMSGQSLALYCLHPIITIFAYRYITFPKIQVPLFLFEFARLTAITLACYTVSLLYRKVAGISTTQKTAVIDEYK